MKELLADITQYLEDILAVNHIGIVTKLAQACRNARAGQADFIKVSETWQLPGMCFCVYEVLLVLCLEFQGQISVPFSTAMTYDSDDR